MIEFEEEIKKYIKENRSLPKVIDIRKKRTNINLANYIDKSKSISQIIDEIVNKEKFEDKLINKSIINWKLKRENVVLGINKFYEKYRRIPKQAEYIEFAKENNYYQKYNWFFDDYNDILKKANLLNMRYRTKFNKEDFIKNVNDLAKQLGKTPTYKEFIETAIKNKWSTSIKDYMSWNDALKMANLELNVTFYSEKDVKDLFENLVVELGRVPTASEFSEKDGYPNATIFQKYFGTYNNFLERMGYPVNRRDRYKEEELKFYLKEFFDRYGNSATRDLFDMQPGYPFNTIYRKRYGSWKKAVKKLVGIDIDKANQFAIPYTSNHGDKRDSAIEGFIDDIIGTLELNHEHGVKYNTLIETEKNYNMDFFIEGRFILEVAGLITRKEYICNGSGIKDKIKKDYLKKMKIKEDLVKKSSYEYIVIFKGDEFKTIISEISKITEKANELDNINKIRTGTGKYNDYKINTAAFKIK